LFSVDAKFWASVRALMRVQYRREEFSAQTISKKKSKKVFAKRITEVVDFILRTKPPFFKDFNFWFSH
jgi:hypothetical protein